MDNEILHTLTFPLILLHFESVDENPIFPACMEQKIVILGSYLRVLLTINNQAIRPKHFAGWGPLFANFDPNYMVKIFLKRFGEHYLFAWTTTDVSFYVSKHLLDGLLQKSVYPTIIHAQ